MVVSSSKIELNFFAICINYFELNSRHVEVFRAFGIFLLLKPWLHVELARIKPASCVFFAPLI